MMAIGGYAIWTMWILWLLDGAGDMPAGIHDWWTGLGLATVMIIAGRVGEIRDSMKRIEELSQP